MEAMMIQGTEIQIKEYKGKRVVTFKDIDAVHQRPLGTANKRFLDNRKRFISGVDFFTVSRDEILNSDFRNLATNNRGITLITESGYLMLVKSFTDDLAWKVQRELVDTYFRVRADINIETGTVTTSEPVSVIDTNKLIKCAEIMAGCLEGNRPYVLNILKNIIPDIEDKQITVVPVQIEGGEVKEVPDMSKKTVVMKRAPREGYNIPFDAELFDRTLWEKHMTQEQLRNEIGCADGLIRKWRTGKSKPGTYYRVRICEALDVREGYFDRRTRRRKVKP